jgi:RNA 3'-terminal phosphate cyclase
VSQLPQRIAEREASILATALAAGAGTFRTTEPTLHTRTNAEVIALFLRPQVTLAGDAGQGWTVNVRAEAEP